MNEPITREQWLNSAAAMIVAEILEPAVNTRSRLFPLDAALPVPHYRISVAPLKSKALAECHPQSHSADGINEIFIDAGESDSLKMLASLHHELIHAFDNCESGHRNFFAQIARATGLEGKLTATVAGETLTVTLQEYVDILGDIPHAKLSIPNKSKGRNNNKLLCACGFKSNLSAKQCTAVEQGVMYQTHGMVHCPACANISLEIHRA